MKRVFNTLHVSVDDIDFDDDRFRITDKGPAPDLTRSINDTGLINPPLLLKQEKGFCIISGFRRLESLRALNHESIDARVAETDDMFYCSRISIVDNAYQRPLTVSEQIRAVKNLATFFSHHDDNNDFYDTLCQVLKIPGNKKQVKKLWVASSLNDVLLDLVYHGQIQLDVALDIALMDSVGRDRLVRFFSTFKVSLNKQKEFVLLVREISAREELPIQDVMDDVERVLESLERSGDKNAVFNAIRKHLQMRRYPILMETYEKHGELVAKLKLPQGITMKVPENFEGIGTHIGLDVKTLEDLNFFIKKLQDISLQPEVKKLFNRDYYCNNFEKY